MATSAHAHTSATSHAVDGLSFTPEQLEARRKTLGASEIPAVAGLTPYRKAIDVYLDKRGLVPPFTGNEFTEWGLRLEDPIATAYADRMGVRLERRATVVHGTETWMSCTPDRIVIPPVGDAYGLEVKNKSVNQAKHWGPSGTDEVPHDIAAQVHWSMLVTGLTRWDVAVLFGGNELRAYRLEFNETIADAMRTIGHTFWHEHVLAGVAPEIDGSERVAAYLKTKFATHGDLVRQATRDEDNMVRELIVLRENRKAIEEDEAVLENRLKNAIAEDAGLKALAGRVTWKATKPSNVVAWEAVARALGATPDVIAQHTTERAGVRRFLVTPNKSE